MNVTYELSQYFTKRSFSRKTAFLVLAQILHFYPTKQLNLAKHGYLAGRLVFAEHLNINTTRLPQILTAIRKRSSMQAARLKMNKTSIGRVQMLTGTSPTGV